MIKGGECAFIVTKPLQLMNAFNIACQLTSYDRFSFYITRSFRYSEVVAEALHQAPPDKSWQFHLVEYPYIKTAIKTPSSLFIDSDVGTKNFLKILILKAIFGIRSVNVYEEGVGSYRRDIYPRWKRSLFKFFGVGWAFGECRLTDGIYLYENEQYERLMKNNKSRRIRLSFVDGLNKFELTYINAFHTQETFKKDFEDQTGLSCAIYLTEWRINYGAIKKIKDFPGRLLIKLHPHIDVRTAMAALAKVSNISSSYCPAELLIGEALRRYKGVVVFHHGSSVEKYMKDDRLHFVRMENTQYED